MREFKLFLMILLLTSTIMAAQDFDYQTLLSSGSTLSIVRKPASLDFNRDKLYSMPNYNPESTNSFQIDLRGYDLTDLDLRDNLVDLMHSNFDDRTIWTSKLPRDFNPKKIMQISRNPGLRVRALHEQGITGKGIGLAIIDQTLLVDHIEYKKQLKLYEEIHIPKGSMSQMHGPAVASIAVGKTVGVAPDADLYYIAETHGTSLPSGGFDWDFSWLAKSIHRILDINKTLPRGRKIRVISISVGWDSGQKGYKDMLDAIERAKNEGVFVVSSSIGDDYQLFFQGLGRNPLDDPDLFASYHEGSWWKKRPFSRSEDTLMIPMDSRCVASPTGKDDYVFYYSGGWSWSIPYIAGLYALACQIKTNITPQQFWTSAIKTGEEFRVNNRRFGVIVDPIKLIEYIKRIP